MKSVYEFHPYFFVKIKSVTCKRVSNNTFFWNLRILKPNHTTQGIFNPGKWF